jgi:hypothetical protein
MMGEKDVIKALSFTPGVSTGVEGSAGLYVRGGTPDQNLMILDGTTVYNTSHLFGFLSVFNPDAIKDIKLIKGGFPARYGGRLSSIIDISTKDGNKQQKQGEGSIGVVSAHYFMETPLKKDTSSLMIAARSAYLGLLALPAYLSYTNGTTSQYQNYNMYDLNAKYNQIMKNGDKVFLSIYTGSDFLRTLSKDGTVRSRTDLGWGNFTTSLRHIKTLKPTLFWSNNINLNNYKYRSTFAITDSTNRQQYQKQQSGITDLSAKTHLDWQPNANTRLSVGSNADRHTFKPNYIFTDDTAQKFNNVPVNAYTVAAYIECNQTFARFFNVNAGLRYVINAVQDTQFAFIEPRLNISYQTKKNAAFQISATRMNQFLHLLSNNGVGLPNDIWLPSTRNTPPQAAYQLSGGWASNIEKYGLNLTIETFYKTFENQIDYRQGTDFFATLGNDWDKLIEKNGIGRAYGLEFLLQKNTGRLTGMLAYTLSKNQRRFAGINRNTWYPYKYDRRHQFTITGAYQISEKWQFASNFVFLSGNAITLPVAYYLSPANSWRPYYEGRNNARMPAYHRLDIAFSKNIHRRRNPQKDGQISFGAYNAYARPNPYSADLRISFDATRTPPYQVTTIQSTAETYSLANFMPYIAYNFKF